MASSLSDLLSAVQNGVIALNNMAVQIKGSLNNILSRFVADEANIATNTANIATNTASIAAMEAVWTVWTPTVVPSGGAFTTVSATGAYLTIGKLVHFTVTITITTVGTANGSMSIALPVGTAKRPAVVFAEETAVVGFVGFGRIATAAAVIDAILKYDNNTYIGAGHNVTLTGIYEQT